MAIKSNLKNLPWSCDTFVVLSDVTANGAVMLGKNSDRPVFDCQPLMYFPAKKHDKGSKIKLSYIEIPQAEETYATIGSSPYWCWGYEQGINEYGVAIGNEAIFTKDVAEAVEALEKGEKIPEGILGMELIRLGLERGKTAKEALEIMTALVEKYGQWGSGVPASDHSKGAYNNSYIIADKNEAWVLETAGKHWIAKKVESYAAISNEPSIRDKWDLISDNLIENAISKKWWPEEKRETFDFAFAYTDFKKPLQLSHIRAQRMRQLLKQALVEQGKISFEWMKRILRDHYEDTFLEGPYFNAALPDFLTICMHSSPAGFTWGNTASSSIFILPKDDEHLPVLWWTPVTPCTGLYLPIFIHAKGLPEILSNAGTVGKRVIAPPEAKEDSYSENSYWWIFKDLLETIKGDEYGSRFEVRQKITREIFDELENSWAIKAAAVERDAVSLMKEGKDEKAAELLSKFTANCVNEALAAVKKVKDIISSI
ncbi:MAG: C69 family dipeptidase [Thermosediminibacteraceae bacterium]|nr:C69 family dipeptidase [Thermosediminibacteraceae bacterium]